MINSSFRGSKPQHHSPQARPPYTGPIMPQAEKLTDRSWTRARSFIVDRWLAYRDLEFPTGKGGAA